MYAVFVKLTINKIIDLRKFSANFALHSDFGIIPENSASIIAE